MADFEIIDHEGRKYVVQPMTVHGGFRLFDNMGYCHEIGHKSPTNTWIKMSHEVHVTPFEYDVKEIGGLINAHYKNLG